MKTKNEEFDENEYEPKTSFFGFLYSKLKTAAIIIIVVWITWPLLMWLIHGAKRCVPVVVNQLCATPFSLDKYGQFGDMYGSFGALFTGLGLLGVAYTFYLNYKEYKRGKYNDIASRCYKLIDMLEAKIQENGNVDGKSLNDYNMIWIKLAQHSDNSSSNFQKLNVKSEWKKARQKWLYAGATFAAISKFLDELEGDPRWKICVLCQLSFLKTLDQSLSAFIALVLWSMQIDVFYDGKSKLLGLPSTYNTFEKFEAAYINHLRKHDNYKTYLDKISTSAAVANINKFIDEQYSR